FYNQTQQMVYYVDGLTAPLISTLSISSYTKADNLMASDVTAFSMDTDSVTLIKNQEIQMKITFANSSSEFTVDRTIAFRNQAAPTPVPGGI
ncbi:MAG: hypothetical protein WBI07_16540, partial [Mobilitalea sp.]